MGTGRELLKQISSRQSAEAFRQENWQGSFDEYLDIARKIPEITRTAHQRIYDMIMAYGTYPIDEGRREGQMRYKFFDDPENNGNDAIYGLTDSLMQLVVVKFTVL